MIWNDRSDMLTVLSDEQLVCWFYPNAVYVDRDLLRYVWHGSMAWRTAHGVDPTPQSGARRAACSVR